MYLLNELAGNSIIVFSRTCNEVQRLSYLVRNLGFQAISLHGQMSQIKRMAALNKFKAGSRNILIATDVASRLVLFMANKTEGWTYPMWTL